MFETYRYSQIKISFTNSINKIPNHVSYTVYKRKYNFKKFKNQIDQIEDKTEHNIAIESFSWHYDISQFMDMGFTNFIIIPWFDIDSSKRNCIVSYEKKIIFLPNYKVMYSSIREFMRKNFKEFAKTPKVSHGLNSSIDLSDAKFDDFFKFSIVRDPWDRYASFYRDKIGRGISHPENYETWVKPLCKILDKNSITISDSIDFISKIPDSHSDNHYLSQTAKLYNKNKCLVDYVGKFENLSDTLSYISDKSKVDFNLERRNQTVKKNSDFMLNYSDRNDFLGIRHRYKLDIKYFDYNKNFK